MKKYYALLVASIACEVFGTSMLKASDGFANPVFVVPFALGYLACFVLLTLALRGLPLGAAYGIWSGVGVAAVSIVGALVWRDPFNLATLVGIASVIVGVVFLESSSGKGSAPAPSVDERAE